jgi:trehalose-phosphatase
LELKGPILALHTREAASQDAVWSRLQFLTKVADLVDTGAARVLRGSEVLELMPNVGPSRANALLAVQQCLRERRGRPVFTMYIGEDAADDDALDVVGDSGVAAVLGRRRAQAAYHLASFADVEVLMRGMILDRRRAHDEHGSERETD